jgi:spindle assembly abnormal protein 6
VLKLQVTSEEDPFFLHTMEVSEEDFQSLKQEQAILVDFGAFPAEVIMLLDACADTQEAAPPPAFRALLRVRTFVHRSPPLPAGGERWV